MQRMLADLVLTSGLGLHLVYTWSTPCIHVALQSLLVPTKEIASGCANMHSGLSTNTKQTKTVHVAKTGCMFRENKIAPLFVELHSTTVKTLCQHILVVNTHIFGMCASAKSCPHRSQCLCVFGVFWCSCPWHASHYQQCTSRTCIS